MVIRVEMLGSRSSDLDCTFSVRTIQCGESQIIDLMRDVIDWITYRSIPLTPNVHSSHLHFSERHREALVI